MPFRSLLPWLRSRFRQPWQFDFPESLRLPHPGCRLRAYESKDFSVCEEIYRLNEPDHFPPEHFPCCAAWLNDAHCLTLVCESDGEVIGFGGITLIEQAGQPPVAILAFGMVHPVRQRQGFGTALLLGRLALLPTHSPWAVFLYLVPKSQSFYRRFGFLQLQSVTGTPEAPSDQFFCHLFPGENSRCRSLLKKAGIAVPRLEVPIGKPS